MCSESIIRSVSCVSLTFFFFFFFKKKKNLASAQDTFMRCFTRRRPSAESCMNGAYGKRFCSDFEDF